MRTKKRLITDRATAVAAHKTVESYLKLPYARILIPENDNRFSAEVLEFPGCVSQGSSAEEAFSNLQKAMVLWINACSQTGKPIPPPSGNYGYSGRLALRLPRDLHRLASRKAERDSVSLNQCLVSAIAAWVGADNLYERLLDRFQKPINFLTQINISSTSTDPSHAPFKIELPPSNGVATAQV